MNDPILIHSSVANAPFRKNLIINGGFDVWQRGTSSTVAGFLADRWSTAWNGSGANHLITRNNFVHGQTEVPGNPKSYLRFACTSAGTGATYKSLLQSIEDVTKTSGQTVTVSFWARSAYSLDVPLILRQKFGSGGAPSANVDTQIGIVSTGSAWEKFTFTATLPSVLMKELGTDNNHCLQMLFESFPLTSTFEFDIAQVQVEIGDTATVFENRPINDEIALCKRYFQKSFPRDTAPGDSKGNLGSVIHRTSSADPYTAIAYVPFSVQMRAQPALTFYNPVRNVVPKLADLNAAMDWPVVGFFPSDNGFNILVNGTDASGRTAGVHWTADAEL